MSREKYRQQNEFLAKDLKQMENEFAVQKRKIEEQQRLIDSLCVTAKVPNQNLMQVSGGNRDVMMQKASEEAQKNERIAMGTNRSTFLHLGENKTKLVSESESSLLQRKRLAGAAVVQDTKRKDQIYVSDETIPAQVFPLIEEYRAKILDLSAGKQQCVLVIDDFFGEAHAILKDTHLKEIARIRNENNVEVMKLKKSLEDRLLREGMQRSKVIGSFDGRAKENHNAFN